MERYYFGTVGDEPDVNCTERCLVKDNGVMIGSATCQECEHHMGNDMDKYGCCSWIFCVRIKEAAGVLNDNQ